MVYAMMLHERGLSSGPTDGKIYSEHKIEVVRILAATLASLSIIADVLAIFWFMRMKRKWRHTLIVMLLVADLLRDVNYISFTAVAFIKKTIVSESHVCQANGFFHQYLTEVTDFVILAIVAHMSVQILRPNLQDDTEGGLANWKKSIVAGIFGLPFVMDCVAFSNKNGGFQLVGAFCALPVRPFWYRLTLSWIPRYMIMVALIVLTIVIRIRVRGYQKKLAELQASMPTQGNVEAGVIQEVDELEESDDDAAEVPEKKMVCPVQEDMVVNEKRLTKISMIEVPPPVPPVPAEHQQFSTDDCRKYKRMSYKRRQLPPINTAALDERTGSVVAPSVAPSSAVFASPTRGDFARNRQSALLDPAETPSPSRRKSIATDQFVRRSQSVIDFPARRASLIEATPRSGSVNRTSQGPFGGNPDRMSSIHSTGRRSSIWDEIDASLEKKVTNNRASIFTITASEAGEMDQVTYDTDNPLASSRPTSMMGPIRPGSVHGERPALSRVASRTGSIRNSKRGSMIYDMARRTVSVISLRLNGEDNEPADSPAAILRRRHRYIQRQLRYLTVFPAVYLLLWLGPLILHVLQYDDTFAVHPPFFAALLNIASMSIFGFVNSVVFCLREKPWTTIADSDGTVSGSFYSFGPVVVVRNAYYRATGREVDDGYDF